MRRLTLLSGSALRLASLCELSASVDLERTDCGPVEARATGLAFHELVRLTVNHAATAPICTNGTANALYASWARHYLPVDASVQREAEVTFCFDVESRTWRILGRELDRQYEEAGIRPTEIPVTVDMIQTDLYKGAACLDWKTGAQVEREPIEEHMQLRAGGCGLARVWGMPEVDIVASYVTEDDVLESYATLYESDFLAIEDALVELHHRVAIGPQARPGVHCKALWCSAVASCPAATQALDEVVALDSVPVLPSGVVTKNAASIRSPEHAAEIFNRLAVAEAQAAAVKKALEAYATVNGPIDLGNGKVYALVDKSEESIVLNDEVEALLEEKLGSALAGDAIKRTLSKKDIAEATKVKAGGSGKVRKALEREVYAALAERGALKKAHWQSVQVVRRKAS